MTPAAIPPSRVWTGDGGFSVSMGEALTSLSPSRASSVRLLGFFFTPLDRTLCGNQSKRFLLEIEHMRCDVDRGWNRWGCMYYELLGAAGAAAEGAEEEDRDGAGEEEAGGSLERGGIVIRREERRSAELHGSLPFGLGDSAGVGGLWLRCGDGRRRQHFSLRADGGGAAEATAEEREGRSKGESARWREAVEVEVEVDAS